MIKEIMPDGRNVMDENGDILPRHDYSRDEYPDPPEEVLRTKAVIRVIDAYEEGRHAKYLASRGSHDREVQKAGGVKACRKRGIELWLEARNMYIRSQGIDTVREPALDDPEHDTKQDEFDRGVALWMLFRKDILEQEDARFAKRHELEQKIEQYERLFY
jgi:hypothetical protein